MTSNEPQKVELIRHGGQELAQRRLTAAEFRGLADVPPEIEWYANFTNPRTQSEYREKIKDFVNFVGIERPEEIREVTRAHVIAWRDHLVERELSAATIRGKLSALSSLFQFLCEQNAVTHNPVTGVKRPSEGSNEGKTPALSTEQARRLLDAPPEDTLKGKRDRAILAVYLFHGLRRKEVTQLKVKDIQQREGVEHFKVLGKGNKIRYVPIAPEAQRRIKDYLAYAGHSDDLDGALFRPVKNNITNDLTKALSGDAMYHNVVLHYARATGLKDEVRELRVHSTRATAITTALRNKSDLAKVQMWSGHANISTTRLYDRREFQPEDSPSFKVTY